MSDKKEIIQGKGRLFGKNFASLFMGNIIYSISQWGMLVVIARLGNPAYVGQYSYALAVTAPVILFLNLQLRNYQATDATNDFKFNQYLCLRIIMMATAYLIIASIALFNYDNINLMLVVLFIGLAKVFESISDVYYGLFQKHEQMHYISKSTMFRGILSVVVLTIVMLVTESIVWGSLAVAISWLALLLIYDLRNGFNLVGSLDIQFGLIRNAFRTIEWNGIKRMAWITLPLGVVATLDSLNSNIPRYFLQGYGGEEVLGYYAAISYFMIAGGTVVTAMLQAVSPKLASAYHSNLELYKKTLAQLTAMSGILGLLGILIAGVLGQPILNLLYGPEYAAYHNVLTMIMVASAIWYIASCLSIALTVSRMIKVQMPIYILSCLSVLGASFYLIPKYELIGAAVSVCIGMLIRATVTLFFVIVSFRRQPKLQMIRQSGDHGLA